MRVVVGSIWSILISILSLLLAPLAVAQVHQPLEFNENRVSFGVKAGDPFDVETGIYYRTYLDLFIDDGIPIRFERTQRNQDTRSRSFWDRCEYVVRHVHHRRCEQMFVGCARNG